MGAWKQSITTTCNPTALCQLCRRNRHFLWKQEVEQVPMIISFHPAPRPKTPMPGGSRRAEAGLSTTFTWLREKLWAPPVVANPKRNRSPAGRLCRQRHGDKTRNTARSKGDDRLSDPSLLSHERDFDYNCFGPSQLIYNGPADRTDCPCLNVTFVLWHLTSPESSSTPVPGTGSHPFKSLPGTHIHSCDRYTF